MHFCKERSIIPAQAAEGDVTDISTLETLFADITEDTATYLIHCAATGSVSNLLDEKLTHELQRMTGFAVYSLLRNNTNTDGYGKQLAGILLGKLFANLMRILFRFPHGC